MCCPCFVQPWRNPLGWLVGLLLQHRLESLTLNSSYLSPPLGHVKAPSGGKLCHTVKTQGSWSEICIDLAFWQFPENLSQRGWCQRCPYSKLCIYSLKPTNYLFCCCQLLKIEFFSHLYFAYNLLYLYHTINKSGPVEYLNTIKQRQCFWSSCTFIGLTDSWVDVLQWKPLQEFSSCGTQHP